MHQQKKERDQAEQEKLQKAVVESVQVVAEQMMDSINAGVTTVFQNQRAIEAESRKLEAQAAKLTSQSVKWVKLLEEFQDGLKELGDVENWAQAIETDMREINEALQTIHKTRVPQ
eukprot:TRINITY_DN1388_c0_g1_i1.p1 TRINITY_DN1388_c0_g1~~TRINITY_DN1388_c0_g1_i1.p1  ORF type:complete len:132 (+),score=29.28 TRINITY_DN1388_c0_g1_i1:50-397(+)